MLVVRFGGHLQVFEIGRDDVGLLDPEGMDEAPFSHDRVKLRQVRDIVVDGQLCGIEVAASAVVVFIDFDRRLGLLERAQHGVPALVGIQGGKLHVGRGQVDEVYGIVGHFQVEDFAAFVLEEGVDDRIGVFDDGDGHRVRGHAVEGELAVGGQLQHLFVAAVEGSDLHFGDGPVGNDGFAAVATGDLSDHFALDLVAEQDARHGGCDGRDFPECGVERVFLKLGGKDHLGPRLEVGREFPFRIGKDLRHGRLAVDEDFHFGLEAVGVLKAHIAADGNGALVGEVHLVGTGVTRVEVDQAGGGREVVG